MTFASLQVKTNHTDVVGNHTAHSNGTQPVITTNTKVCSTDAPEGVFRIFLFTVRRNISTVVEIS